MKLIHGKVKKGEARGRALGFPTANINLSEKIEEGIYVSYALLSNKKLPSLTFIGAAVTFGEEKIQAETYIFEFDEDIYGKELRVELLKKIRDNQKFKSKEELIAQMEEDKKVALEYFTKNV